MSMMTVTSISRINRLGVCVSTLCFHEYRVPFTFRVVARLRTLYYLGTRYILTGREATIRVLITPAAKM